MEKTKTLNYKMTTRIFPYKNLKFYPQRAILNRKSNCLLFKLVKICQWCKIIIIIVIMEDVSTTSVQTAN